MHMSSVSSEQSCVCEGAGYDKVFLSGQNDPGTSSDERNPLATSPSLKDEDLDTDRSASDSTDDLDGTEPPIQSVLGPDGLREFIMLPLWTVNKKSLPLNKHTSTHLRKNTRYPTPYPSVYHTNPRSVTIEVLMTSGYMSKC